MPASRFSGSSYSRRDFIARVPAAAAALALLPSGRNAAAPAAPPAAQPKVACQANAFPPPKDFPALLGVLRQMKELGYDGFECNVRFVVSEFGQPAAARKQLSDTGVAFIGIHLNMLQAKPDSFPGWVESVAALGASCIVMSGAGLAPDGNFAREALHRKAATLQELGRTCRRGGLRLAYHNHNPEFARQNAEMEGLAAETDPAALSFLMDAGHAKLGGGDPAHFLRRFPSRIVGCHLKTYRGKQQVPLGEGDWGFEDLATAIRETNWTGWLINEEGGGPKTGNTAALQPDRSYIRRVFGV